MKAHKGTSYLRSSHVVLLLRCVAAHDGDSVIIVKEEKGKKPDGPRSVSVFHFALFGSRSD